MSWPSSPSVVSPVNRVGYLFLMLELEVGKVVIHSVDELESDDG